MEMNKIRLLDITNFVTATFAGLFGCMAAAPSYFFSRDGKFPLLFSQTFDSSSDFTSLDPITCLFFRCSAAESATICLTYYLRVLGSHDEVYRRAYARVCLCIHLTMLPLCIRNVMDSSGVFVTKSFVVQAIFNATMSILIGYGLGLTAHDDKVDSRQVLNRSSSSDPDSMTTQNASNHLTALFIGSYALPAYLMPNTFYGPEGVYPLFYRTTLLPFQELDPIEIFSMRVMASCISYAVLQNHYLNRQAPSLLNKMNAVTNMFILHPIMEEARSGNGWSVRWTFGGICALILILRYIEFRAAGFFDAIGQPSKGQHAQYKGDLSVRRTHSAQL